MKILIIDDEAIFRMMIESFLDREGHDLVFAENGEEGIKKARVHQLGLILLDGKMPGISGFKTCMLIKKDAKIKNIPVIMLTALDKVGDVEDAFKAGADEYIAKPIEANTFVSILNRKYKRIVGNRPI
ncbi:MAG: CheY-like chemotaxis protein [Nitrospinales bacterium]|jgi:CheY-like chemotaxis protein